jgi:hypothetical protein
VNDLECQVYAASGLRRLQLQALIESGDFTPRPELYAELAAADLERDSAGSGKPKTGKGKGKAKAGGAARPSAAVFVQQELQRGPELLFRAFQAHCVVINPDSRTLVSNPALSVSEQVTSLVKRGYDAVVKRHARLAARLQADPAVRELRLTLARSSLLHEAVRRDPRASVDYGLYAESLFHILAKMAKFAAAGESAGLLRQADSWRQSGVQFFAEAAEVYYFLERDVDSALYCLHKVAGLQAASAEAAVAASSAKGLSAPMSTGVGISAPCIFGSKQACHLPTGAASGAVGAAAKGGAFSTLEVLDMMKMLQEARGPWEIALRANQTVDGLPAVAKPVDATGATTPAAKSSKNVEGDAESKPKLKTKSTSTAKSKSKVKSKVKSKTNAGSKSKSKSKSNPKSKKPKSKKPKSVSVPKSKSKSKE